MSTKCSKDLIIPLFVGVDVSPEGDVVIICDIDMKVEAAAMLSHFGIYVAFIFWKRRVGSLYRDIQSKDGSVLVLPLEKLCHRKR